MIAVLALILKHRTPANHQSQIAAKLVGPVNLARQPLGIAGFC